jgi:hypothetical protein
VLDRLDYLEKLRQDLIEQFKEKPKIDVFQKAMARQLSQVYRFFAELNTLRWLQTAEGVQLDGIGDIVVLSRMEALAVSKMADQNIPMDDEIYRLYLLWKIGLNTNNCTHSDRHKLLRLFWSDSPLYYSENPAYPATIFITIPVSVSNSRAAIFDIAWMINAAGVGLHFIFAGDAFSVTDYTAGVIIEYITEFIVDVVDVPVLEATSYDAGALYDAVFDTTKEADENG